MESQIQTYRQSMPMNYAPNPESITTMPQATNGNVVKVVKTDTQNNLIADEQPNFANLRPKNIAIRNNILNGVLPLFTEVNYWFPYNILTGDFLNGLIDVSRYESKTLIDHILLSFCNPIEPTLKPQRGFSLLLTEGNLRKAIDLERKTKDEFYNQHRQPLSLNLMAIVNGLIATSNAKTQDIVTYVAARYREQYLQINSKR